MDTIKLNLFIVLTLSVTGLIYAQSANLVGVAGDNYSNTNYQLNWSIGETLTEKGLYKITPFNNFTSKDNLPDYVWSIVEDNAGKLWFSSYGNRYLYYMQNHKIHRYPKQFNSPAFFFGASKISNGNLLFPTEHGVYVYDGKQFVFDNLSINSSVLSIYEDHIKSKIYFGSFEGLIYPFNR